MDIVEEEQGSMKAVVDEGDGERQNDQLAESEQIEPEQ